MVKKIKKIKKKKILNPVGEEPNVAFKTAVESTTGIFQAYSVQDILTSLFISHLWLPNIASGIKHQFLLSVFMSLEPSKLLRDNKISTYDDFKAFLHELYSEVPSFPMIEDYIPESDWGDVKFYHDDRICKFFYGQELSNVYDYMMLFQMIYGPFDKEYCERSGRSPSLEMRYCLRLQDDIISGISFQPDVEALQDVAPGHIEIPSEEFWKESSDFYNEYNLRRKYDEAFLRNYSVELGSWPRANINSEVFHEMVHQGRVMPSFFIFHDGRYYPILPRRYSSILFDSWAKIYIKNYRNVTNKDMSYSFYIGGQFYRYIKARINSSFLYPLVSAVFTDGTPHELLFSTSFISKDRLILFYMTNPAYSRDQIETELNILAAKLNEAKKLIETPPVTLALHRERMNVKFSQGTEGDLKPELFVIIPQVSTDMFSISVPTSLPGSIIFMDQIIGIIDELDNAEMLAAFMEYIEEYGDIIKSPLASLLDIFGSFKDSLGVLVEGAQEYTFISIDPHWGTRLRYKTLSEFWKIYPGKHFFDHPRSWKVTKETESRIRLEARGYFGGALYCRVNATHIFLNAPFDKMSYEQGQLANLLMECLEDSISNNVDLIKEHQFFKIYDQFQVLFFPTSLVNAGDDFKHLKHLIPGDGFWKSDGGRMNRDAHGIRLVFNDELLRDAFVKATDRSLDVALLVEALARLDEIAPDTNRSSIIESLEARRIGKPRFKMFTASMKASFPQFINPHKPSLNHFKRAKKRIAELARSIDLSEGHYELDNAKLKMNALRDALIKEINSEVNKYEFGQAIPYLLSRIDALTHEYERKTLTIEFSIDHDVDYAREKDYAEQHTKYVTMHRNYRYLIEKFVQLEPDGTLVFDKEQFQCLIALIDWLHVFYMASDVLHYGIDPVGMKVNEHFLVDVEYKGDWEAKEKEFGEEMALLNLGLLGNSEDKVSSPRPIEKLLDELDCSFRQEFGFSFRSMINILQILAVWAAQNDSKPYYSATMSEIEETCSRNIKEIKKSEIAPLVDFLTLKKGDVLRIVGEDEICFDLPAWEHRKRSARYTLRPLILMDDKYYWGPYSALKAALTWSGNLSYGTLPIDLQSRCISQVIDAEKKLIEDALGEKAFVIIKRFTDHIKKNCALNKLDKVHSSDLGDFDVIAYLTEKNVILNIECKDILPVFCVKDAKRLREKIFGRPGKDKGHFEQIGKRQRYLSENLIAVKQTLAWPIDVRTSPRIVTVYLTRLTYWWTRFPPIEVDANFLRIDMLSKFVEEL